MYGIPSQSISQWQDSLKKIKDFEINHLSTYNLTFEKGTPFYSWKKQGKITGLRDKKVASCEIPVPFISRAPLPQK